MSCPYYYYYCPNSRESHVRMNFIVIGKFVGFSFLKVMSFKKNELTSLVSPDAA